MPADHTTETNPIRTALWERTFTRVLTPLAQFIQQQSTSSFLLLLCTVIALALANSSFSEAYLHLLHTPISVAVGSARFEMSLQHWINEVLMSFFFLLVGLELKRELVLGELADKQRAALPAIAAIGGMVVPATVYWLLNPSGASAAGWGIPMATDIAFAIGALSALGKRISPALVTFLIALAIVDDIGAVLVIAFFYTEQLHTAALLICLLLTAVLVILNLGGIRHLAPYLLVGVLLWCAMLNSGIHATLAGVVLAFTIPMHPKYSTPHFVSAVNELARQMQSNVNNKPSAHENETLHVQIATLEKNLELAQAPAQRLEHQLHFSVAFLVVPLFALANAAIPIRWNELATTLAHPVTLGVTGGLIVGKWLGVVAASWLAVKLKVAALPIGVQMRHIHGIGLLAGIGFTMSIFVADLAFSSTPELLLMAKTGILFASFAAAFFGYCWLRFACNSSRMHE